MNLNIEHMNEKRATDILTWQYEKPYDFYNNEVTEEALQELLDGTYYTLVDKYKDLIGFFTLEIALKCPLEINLGLT